MPRVKSRAVGATRTEDAPFSFTGNQHEQQSTSRYCLYRLSVLMSEKVPFQNSNEYSCGATVLVGEAQDTL